MPFVVCFAKVVFLQEGGGINPRPNLTPSLHFSPLMPTPMRYAHTYTHAHYARTHEAKEICTHF